MSSLLESNLFTNYMVWLLKLFSCSSFELKETPIETETIYTIATTLYTITATHLLSRQKTWTRIFTKLPDHPLRPSLHYALQFWPTLTHGLLALYPSELFYIFFNYSAVDADVMIVKEIGLDPGIDHMLAMECFDDIRDGGAKVGGL